MRTHHRHLHLLRLNLLRTELLLHHIQIGILDFTRIACIRRIHRNEYRRLRSNRLGCRLRSGCRHRDKRRRCRRRRRYRCRRIHRNRSTRSINGIHRISGCRNRCARRIHGCHRIRIHPYRCAVCSCRRTRARLRHRRRMLYTSTVHVRFYVTDLRTGLIRHGITSRSFSFGNRAPIDIIFLFFVISVGNSQFYNAIKKERNERNRRKNDTIHILSRYNLNK